MYYVYIDKAIDSVHKSVVAASLRKAELERWGNEDVHIDRDDGATSKL